MLHGNRKTNLTSTGYDTGYISSVLVSVGTALGHELSSSEQELVTSLTSGGALCGAVFAGLVADRFGRKMPIWVACVVFVIGTVLQTAAYHVPQFAVGRFVVGLGGMLEHRFARGMIHLLTSP